MSDKEEALAEVVSAQRQYEAVGERLMMYREAFRNERDVAVAEAVRVGVSKADICAALGVTPQWLNRMLRGKAYR